MENIIDICNRCKLVEVITSNHPDILPGAIGILVEQNHMSGVTVIIPKQRFPAASGDKIESREVWFAKEEVKPYTIPSTTLNLINEIIRVTSERTNAVPN